MSAPRCRRCHAVEGRGVTLLMPQRRCLDEYGCGRRAALRRVERDIKRAIQAYTGLDGDEEAGCAWARRALDGVLYGLRGGKR